MYIPEPIIGRGNKGDLKLTFLRSPMVLKGDSDVSEKIQSFVGKKEEKILDGHLTIFAASNLPSTKWLNWSSGIESLAPNFTFFLSSSGEF